MDIKEIKKTWHDRLTERLDELGLTYLNLAQRTGISPSAIGSYARGARTPSISKFGRLEKSLSVPPGWLMYGEEIKTARKYEKTPDFLEIRLPILQFCDVFEYAKYGKLPPNCHHQSITVVGKQLKKGIFMIRVVGEGMVSDRNPELSLHEGELALIDLHGEWGHRSLVMAKIGEHVTIRQLQYEGSEAYLNAFNAKIPNVPLGRDVEILGVVVQVVKMYA